MPRGVPASGKRQPRAVSAAGEAAETPVAFGAVDESFGFDEASEEEVPPVVEAPDSVSLVETPGPLVPPVPDHELTPEQREIKQLRDMLARKQGREDVEPEVEEITSPGEDGNILIHFLEDGFTAQGRVWYRGQELEFVPGSRAHQDTFNRLGQSWLDLRSDEFAQVERYGKVMFRTGPWPGKTYLDGSFEALRGEREGSRVVSPSEDELAAAERLRKRRAAPHMPSQI